MINLEHKIVSQLEKRYDMDNKRLFQSSVSMTVYRIKKRICLVFTDTVLMKALSIMCWWKLKSLMKLTITQIQHHILS